MTVIYYTFSNTVSMTNINIFLKMLSQSKELLNKYHSTQMKNYDTTFMNNKL